jgi:predicted dehydrogenase
MNLIPSTYPPFAGPSPASNAAPSRARVRATGSTVNYGLLGCGMMGQEHLRNILLQRDAAVTAILEPDPAMRALAAALAPRARLVDRIEDLLASDVDALVIASPNHHHVAQIAQIAARRPLPLMVEKPACISLEEARRLEALAVGYPAPLWVAMEYRYMPPVARLIARRRSGPGACGCSRSASTGIPSCTRSGRGTGSTAPPAARWWRSAATSST